MPTIYRPGLSGPYRTPVDEKRCAAAVHGGVIFHQCRRAAVVSVTVNGANLRFCRQHAKG